MSNSIKLSPKHGLNPVIPVCFFCGEQKNEIAIMGRINRQDDEAPKNLIVDYEPCDKCKEKFAQGVLIIEVTRKDLGRPCIAKDVQPTGRYVVVRPEALNNNSKAGDKALMIDDEFNQVFGGNK